MSWECLFLEDPPQKKGGGVPFGLPLYGPAADTVDPSRRFRQGARER